MSASTTTATPAGLTEDREQGRIRRMAAKAAAGTAVAAALTAFTLAVWPDSAAEKARADGEAIGSAAAALYNADTAGEAVDARSDLVSAVRDARLRAGDAVADQVEKQEDALNRAVNGYVGTLTADTQFDADVYQSELDYARADLANQADDFRSTGSEVQQAFWEGVDSGLNGG
jgi:hypothetical protein